MSSVSKSMRAPARPPLRRILVAILLVLATRAAGAQELRGRVLDSASNQPVLGAVLVLKNAAGNTVGRNITNERGEFRLSLASPIASMRVVRLGFRPREIPIPSNASGVAKLDVVLVSIPSLLEPVRVAGSTQCPRRADAAKALALLDQARAGLLAAVVASEANPATLKRLAFERRMDGPNDRILKQSVRVDSSAQHRTSFQAVSSAAGFVRDGFTKDSAGTRIYYGPDAEVLLDDAFAGGYCFRLLPPERDRPNQAGVGFAAADRRRGRVDVDGALWIDTVARVLQDLQFRYVGLLERELEATKPSGSIFFREMPNGVVLIERWSIRLPDIQVDNSYDVRAGRDVARSWIFAREFGGQVALASWPGMPSWQAPLGTAHIRVMDERKVPVRGVTLRLDETDYVASPDDQGNVVFTDLLPGPYRVMVIDSATSSAGIVLGTSLTLQVARDSAVLATLVPPSSSNFTKKRCVQGAGRWVSIYAVTPEGQPLRNGRWELGEDLDQNFEKIVARGVTDAEGELGFCDLLARRSDLQVRIWSVAEPGRHVILSLNRAPASMTVRVPASRN